MKLLHYMAILAGILFAALTQPAFGAEEGQSETSDELVPSVEDSDTRTLLPAVPPTSETPTVPGPVRPPLKKAKGPDEEEFVDIHAAPPLVSPEEGRTSVEGGLLGAYNDSNLLLLGLRTDTTYFAGSVLQQGFALSSVRLTAWGSSGNHLSYRFSIGQTREFSSVFLPQLTPVEAWVDFHTASLGDWGAHSRLNWRIGMFTPTFSPWWSPDLADMQVLVPDYLQSHRALFLSRDLGTELTMEPISDSLFLTVGVFNGNGIISYNTNSAKAFTFSAQAKIPVYESKIWIGASGYIMNQADPTSISFKNNGVWNVYTAWEYPNWKAWLAFELFGGELNDSTRTATPIGTAAMLQFRLSKGLRWFSRAEQTHDTGRGGNNRLASVQMGPVLDFHKTAQLFLLFNHAETEDSSNENYGYFRLRLQL